MTREILKVKKRFGYPPELKETPLVIVLVLPCLWLKLAVAALSGTGLASISAKICVVGVYVLPTPKFPTALRFNILSVK